MVAEKMNVHQALAELKMLDKRIGNAIREGSFVVPNKHSNTKIGGIDIKDHIADVKSRYQKIQDLIARRNAIKRAVVQSNAVTRVMIGNVEYTVAEAIDMKNHGMEYLMALRDRLSLEYKVAKQDADQRNGSDLSRRADDYIRTMVGNTDVKGMTEDVKKMRDDFITAQTTELVDPIGALGEIQKMNDVIDAFLTNVDACLSVSNATTEIEISY
jgi:hypothetical protein